ncbi:branched-chain amino acid ABC transporter permease [Euzebya sp.]|uniref:branched-chain amino acid ABC transporter permease n=1 Tax=Euzebya sp. TaxID=1971409 RepID=UPI00351531CF
MLATILDGIVDGLQLGLLGIGLSLLYGLGGVLNLAHGAIGVGAAMIISNAMGAGWPVGVAAAVGIAAAGLFGVLMDRSIMRWVYAAEGEHRVLLSLLLTLGTAFAIDGLIGWRYPNKALSVRIGGGSIDLLGVPMRAGSIYAAGIAVVCLAVIIYVLRRTSVGRAVRSIIQDEEGAKLVGVNPAAMRTAIFAVGTALAGLVAVTTSMTSPVTVNSGFDFTIEALIVTVVGGLGSASGALLAGILLGIVNALSSFYIGAYITSIILLAAAGLTILLKPSGLMGRAA